MSLFEVPMTFSMEEKVTVPGWMASIRVVPPVVVMLSAHWVQKPPDALPRHLPMYPGQ
jgi:hypothetical protein